MNNRMNHDHDSSEARLTTQSALSGDSSEPLERHDRTTSSILWDPKSYKDDLVSSCGSITKAAKELGLSRSTLYSALKKETMPSATCREAIANWRNVEEHEIWPNAPRSTKADLEEIVSQIATDSKPAAVQALMDAAKNDIRLMANLEEGQVRLILLILTVYHAYLTNGVDCSMILGAERGHSTKVSTAKLLEQCRKLERDFPDHANTGKGVFRFQFVDSSCLPEQLHLAIDHHVYYRVIPGLTDVAIRTYRKRSRKRPR